MRAPSRAVGLFVVVAAAVTLHASQPCLPPAPPALHWLGQTTGCTESNQTACAAGEIIVFSVTPVEGNAYPGCITYLWQFGDGATSTQPSPAHAYVLNGAFFVLVTVSNGQESETDGKQIIIAATVTPSVESFTATPAAVRRGETVVLAWVTRTATEVQIDGLGVRLPATQASYAFVPTATKTYQLVAFSGSATARSAPTTVYVSAKRRAVRR